MQPPYWLFSWLASPLLFVHICFLRNLRSNGSLALELFLSLGFSFQLQSPRLPSKSNSNVLSVTVCLLMTLKNTVPNVVLLHLDGEMRLAPCIAILAGKS